MNTQYRNKLTDTENKLMLARWKGDWEEDEKGERGSEVQVASNKVSHGDGKVQHGEYSQ